MDLLVARELELGSAEGLNLMLLVLQLGVDGHNVSSNIMFNGYCALGLSKGTMHTRLEPRLEIACQL